MTKTIQICSVAILAFCCLGQEGFAQQLSLPRLGLHPVSPAIQVDYRSCQQACYRASMACKARAGQGFTPLAGINRCNDNYNNCKASCY